MIRIGIGGGARYRIMASQEDKVLVKWTGSVGLQEPILGASERMKVDRCRVHDQLK